MADRHERHSLSQCVTSAGQNDRHTRHTTLGSVTGVTLARSVSDLSRQFTSLDSLSISKAPKKAKEV